MIEYDLGPVHTKSNELHIVPALFTLFWEAAGSCNTQWNSATSFVHFLREQKEGPY